VKEGHIKKGFILITSTISAKNREFYILQVFYRESKVKFVWSEQL
jgi:hypothetical protein